MLYIGYYIWYKHVKMGNFSVSDEENDPIVETAKTQHIVVLSPPIPPYMVGF